MKVRLLDYKNKEHFVEIPDDTKTIVINIVSGDMVMVQPIHYDTSNNRIMNYYDGTVVLDKSQFHILDEAKLSYDIFYNEEE